MYNNNISKILSNKMLFVEKDLYFKYSRHLTMVEDFWENLALMIRNLTPAYNEKWNLKNGINN